MMFTGAAGRIAPAAGVVSAVCGLMAVLAFVL
jgi:flagellar motor component MotA